MRKTLYRDALRNERKVRTFSSIIQPTLAIGVIAIQIVPCLIAADALEVLTSGVQDFQQLLWLKLVLAILLTLATEAVHATDLIGRQNLATPTTNGIASRDIVILVHLIRLRKSWWYYLFWLERRRCT